MAEVHGELQEPLDIEAISQSMCCLLLTNGVLVTLHIVCICLPCCVRYYLFYKTMLCHNMVVKNEVVSVNGLN